MYTLIGDALAMPIARGFIMARAHIGTSGWNYKHWWNGEFYPQELRPADWLRYFVKHFDTVEINNSFYRLPSEEAFQSWRSQVPQNFVFAVKASRFLTHIKRLKDPEEPLRLFFSRAKFLKDRLGPILFQLPPRFKLNLERLDAFLTALTTHTAGGRVRCAIEVRDATWLVPQVFERLRIHHVALCFADWRDTHVTDPVTGDFVYVRRHSGPAAGGNYPKENLNRDAEQIRRWLAAGLDVYMYFNNDWGGHAIRNAKYIRQAILNAGSGRRKQAARSTKLQDSLKRS
jgi:uncharacterized protein YecE (DUF72 family)